jgi:hypothetical protein
VKVLLDECVNNRIIRYLVGFDIKTVQKMGWAGIKNGTLLGLAETQFDAFVTIDQNLSYQQSIKKFNLALIVIETPSNNLTALLPFMPHLVATLPRAPKGELTTVSLPAAAP